MRVPRSPLGNGGGLGTCRGGRCAGGDAAPGGEQARGESERHEPAGKAWTNDGAVHEIHSLRRRAAKATRSVPIPPELVRMLREHIERFSVAPDGLLFRNAAGNYIEAAAYGITWGRAREATLTLDEHALVLAKRPYDLRYAGISFWLASGVDPAECARRAGQSVQVLFRYYAKFLAEARNHANTLIEESMRRWDEPESGA